MTVNKQRDSSFSGRFIIFIKRLYPANLRCAVACGFRCFTDTEFFNLPVVNYFLMSLLVCLLTPVFTQSTRPLYPLFLPLAATQPVLMRHGGHQIDKHAIDGGYNGAGDRVSLRKSFI